MLRSFSTALVLTVAACTNPTPSSDAIPSTTGGPSAAASASAAVTGPALKPVGTILFVRTTGNDSQAFYIANADATDKRQLTQAGEFCCVNRVSPDRAEILVMPGGEPPTPVTGGLLTMDGTNFTLLKLNDPTLNLVPEAWSPDGTRLAFEGWDDSDPTRTGMYTGNGRQRDRCRSSDIDRWSPARFAARLLARRDEARLLSCGSRRAGLPDRYRWVPLGG